MYRDANVVTTASLHRPDQMRHGRGMRSVNPITIGHVVTS